MLGSPHQWIRRSMSLWINMISLAAVHSNNKGSQTKGKMIPTNQDVKGSYSKDKRALCSFVMKTVPNILQKDMGP